jgi:hypothetical protein
MTQTVLPQLQEIEADLVTQENQLSAQLEALQAKLKGIRAVIPMFSGDSGAVSGAVVEFAEADLAPEDLLEDLSEDVATERSSSGRKSAKAPAKTKANKAKAKRSVAKTDNKKVDGRAADWQKYTRPGVKNQSIPDAVKLILTTQPDKEFKIAEVMEALFVDDIPKAQYLKARNRVSNVLSGGVRAGDWHRGARSTYRMSAA